MPDPQLAQAIHDARPVRFGVHGSPHLAARIVVAAGHSLDTVQFVPYDISEPFRPLRERRADIMVVKYALQEPDISISRPVAFDPRVVIVGAGHPLAGRDTVSIEEIARYNAFQCPGDFPPYVWDRIVPPRTPSGKAIVRVHAMTTAQAMIEILTTTQAVHVSFESVGAALPPRARAIPVHDLPPAPVALAWLRGVEPSPAAAALVADAEDGAATDPGGFTPVRTPPTVL